MVTKIRKEIQAITPKHSQPTPTLFRPLFLCLLLLLLIPLSSCIHIPKETPPSPAAHQKLEYEYKIETVADNINAGPHGPVPRLREKLQQMGDKDIVSVSIVYLPEEQPSGRAPVYAFITYRGSKPTDPAPKPTIRGASDELKARVQKPQIVSMEPVNGNANVDPNLQELRVTFNTPMGPGFSWCGGGPNFPEAREGQKVHWSEDRRTCIFPVVLKPNWEYNLNLNSLSASNFQSEAGVALEPVGYNFRTR